MRIVIFTNEFPYPANNGGRVDIFNGIKALKILGHQIFFVGWAIYEDNQRDSSVAEVKKVVDELVVYKRNNTAISRIKNIALKLLLLPLQPNMVTDCQLDKASEKELTEQISLFKPDLVLCYSVFAAKEARIFALKFHIPFFIRSHNIEHLYVKKQLSNVTSAKSFFKLFGSYSSLKKYEIGIFSKADGILDISNNDAAFWKAQGIKNVHWQPPVVLEVHEAKDSIKKPKLYDICYIGNLYNPNNIKGLYWFLSEVLPIVEKAIPDIKICFAGSKPANELIETCKKYNGVVIKANPPDVSSFYLESKLMINPTLFGSGVNLKTIEQLFEDVPVVCTSVALAGLPDDFNKVFNTADSPDEFAALIIQLVNNYGKGVKNPETDKVRTNLRQLFSAEHYGEVLIKALEEAKQH